MSTLQNKILRVNISRNSISVADKRTGKVWEAETSFIINCWDLLDCRLKEISVSNPNDCLVKLTHAGNNKRVFVYDHRALGIKFQVKYALFENYLEVNIPISRIKEYKSRFILMSITPLPMFGGVVTGEKGYMLLPNSSGIACSFDKKVSKEHRNMIYGEGGWQPNCVTMPVFGIVHKDSVFLGIITSGEFDAELITTINKEPENTNSIYFSFHYRYEKADEIDKIDRVVRYYFLAKEEANYVDMAKTYRNYLLKEKKIKTLKDKIKKSKSLQYYCSSYNDIRISLAAKAYEKGGEGEGKGKFNIYTNFEEAKSIVKAVKECGIDKATFLLVGWTYDGADGAYPTKFPPDIRLGGEKGLSELILYAKSLGYQIVSWDNYTDVYKISPDWNPFYIQKDRDRWLVRGGSWAGGKAYRPCPQEGIKFAHRDLPRMKAMGFKGIWLIDAMPLQLFTCFDKDHSHPHTRRALAEGLKKIIQLARKVFGGCHVEDALDYAADSFDAVSLLPISKQISKEASAPPWAVFYKYFLDKFVPFFQIAYHGIIQYHFYCPFSWDRMDGMENEFLHEIEYGAMPRNEITFRKGQQYYKKWLPLMKKQYEVIVKKMGYLQLEFIEDHRETAPSIFETSYSDGTKVICNYKEKSCILKTQKSKEKIIPGG